MLILTNVFKDMCFTGNLEGAKKALSSNPDIDISDGEDYAFRNACKSGNLEIAQWLLSIKPDINNSCNNENAFTPLGILHLWAFQTPIFTA